jgi:hypothetical protein
MPSPEQEAWTELCKWCFGPPVVDLLWWVRR